MKFSINSKVLQAAMVFMATGDVRKYLCGVRIHADGRVYASDGHTGFKAELDPIAGIDDHVVVRIAGQALPAAAEEAHIEISDETGAGTVWFSDKDARPVMTNGFKTLRPLQTITEVPGNGPINFERVFSPKDGDGKPWEPKAVAQVCLGTEYMARIHKANMVFKKYGLWVDTCEMIFFGQHNQVMIRPTSQKQQEFNIKYLVMPRRL